jgi:hypothetical protein
MSGLPKAVHLLTSGAITFSSEAWPMTFCCFNEQTGMTPLAVVHVPGQPLKISTPPKAANACVSHIAGAAVDLWTDLGWTATVGA